MQEDARTAAELEAVQNWPCAIESETSSERNDRQEREADYVGSPETIQGDNGKEDNEYTGEGNGNEENKNEGEASQVVEAKGMKPGGGRPKGRGVDG